MHSNNSAEIGPCGNTRASALVLGSGLPALVAAQALAHMGVSVTFGRFENTRDNVFLPITETVFDDPLREISGRTDGLEILDLKRTADIRRECEGFRAKFDDCAESFYDCLLLAPGISLSTPSLNLPEGTELFTSHTEAQPAARIVFLLDYNHPTDPALGMRAIRLASDNAANGGESVVCFRHVPVMHLFGETLYDSARSIGVQFVRFGDELPVISCLDDNQGPHRFRLSVRDAIDDGSEFTWDCARVLSVTGPDAASIPAWAAEIAGKDVDDQGLVLSESVHCHSGSGFASGVFLIGDATGNLDLIGNIAQAQAAAAKAVAWMRTSRLRKEKNPVAISPACVGCLTCHRVCPHGAISVKTGTFRKPIVPCLSLCRECGICASICPSLAIDLTAGPEGSLMAAIKEIPQADLAHTTLVFGCQRSAGLLAKSIRMPERVKFMPVPCAGRVSERLIWFALANGAKGILVVGCHHGNCASHSGTDWAGARIGRALASGLLSPGKPKLGYATIAPNEAARFDRILREFEADLRLQEHESAQS